LILKNNKGKAGVYRWTNLVNHKSYIGSANDLRTRFYVYFSVNRLTKSKMTIYKAILKYGYKKFSLDILDYCNPDVLLEREQYYIDLLKPEYNNLGIAGSSLGYKHTSDTLKKFKIRKFSDIARTNLAKAATGRVLNKEIKTNISLARKGIKLSNETKIKLSTIATAREGVAVEVRNITSGKIKQYPTLTSASLALGISRTAIRKSMVSGIPIKKTYFIKSINKK